MDLYVTNTDICKRNVEDVPHEVKLGVNGGENELKSLLSPKVQWSDRKGENLVEVLEFHPSDASDAEDEEDSDSCICTIM